MPSVYISSICFYNKNDAYSKFSSETAKSSVLKKSLSDVLKCYYPLTGCVKDNLIVDCNDEGILYLEAQVKCQLSDIAADPNLAKLKKFLPCDIDGAHHLAFAAQVNYFTCGGIAIGACISRKIADGSSFSTFVKNWVATSRVNLRTRMDPPLSDYSFGNLFQVTIAIVSKETSREDCYGIVVKLRDAKGKIDKDYVKKLQGSEHLEILKELSGKIMTQDNVVLNFTALCGFPLYDVDFGWGEPFLVGWVSLPFKNLMTFSDTKLGDGIEAWINLNEEDMAKFECDKELLAYATTSFRL
ncbi:(13S,14R)-1,13-dihydroxy-N-methylcanadine 13-O-acetyltransferase AT1-like [Quercus robur]|uniref:(13S,14R)-1,13-dihydroxy-N-methylcanadine 13-O-acetyltransferase AT1-like n=1 Tax=Quercus robur TaxID=38942 RepID=UPI002161D850|nr:(13S,14R)-1,13-dihydroxy-N-methylcanadine 13-O-acetyltransferase AT1-like [Quercus robur]